MNVRMLTGFALSIQSDGTYEAFSPEAWKYAGEMTLLGMGMIFAVLACLWVVLMIFKLVFAEKNKTQVTVEVTPVVPRTPKLKKKDKKNGSAPKGDAEIAAAIAASIHAADVSEAERNAALIAVLTAAVHAYREGEGETGAFRVVSFKRAGGAWNTKR